MAARDIVPPGRRAPCNPKACSGCPWRVSVRQQAEAGTRPDPHGFYGLRKGDAPGMSCHPTDDRMGEFDGYAPPAGAEFRECTGSLIVMQREMRLLEAEMADRSLRNPIGDYQRKRGRGGALTRSGIAAFMERLLFGGGYDAVDLDDVDVQHPFVPDWVPGIRGHKDPSGEGR